LPFLKNVTSSSFSPFYDLKILLARQHPYTAPFLVPTSPSRLVKNDAFFIASQRFAEIVTPMMLVPVEAGILAAPPPFFIPPVTPLDRSRASI